LLIVHLYSNFQINEEARITQSLNEHNFQINEQNSIIKWAGWIP